MVTCTAQITIGDFPGGWAGPNIGIGPQRILYLLEGSRAAWVLERVVHNSDEDEFTGPVTWVPRGPENLLADALVMIAALVEANGDVQDLIAHRLGAKAASKLLTAPYVDLPELDGDLFLEIEDAAATAVKSKLVVTVMNGSSLVGQLGLLERCSMIAEVCSASWVRQPDADGNLQTGGELPPEDPDAHRFTALRIS